MELMGEKMTARTLLDFENDILDLFEKNKITIQDAKDPFNMDPFNSYLRR